MSARMDPYPSAGMAVNSFKGPCTEETDQS